MSATLPDRSAITAADRIAALPLAWRSTRLSSRAVAAAGRYVLVWMSLAMIAAAEHPLDTAGAAGVSLAAAVWLGALRMAAAGAPYALGPWVHALIGTSTGLVCVTALNPHLPGLGLSLAGVAGAGLGVLVSIGVWESVIERTLGRRRILVVGRGATRELAAAVQRGRGMTLALLDGEEARASGSVLDALDPILAVRPPDLIVLTDEQTCSETLERLLDIADGRFRVASLTSFYEYALGCVPVRLVTPMWFMSLLHICQRGYNRCAKRTFDLVVAAFALAITAPLLPLIALAVRRTPGPVIYRQTRVGEGGRRFTIYKIRTMVDRAEQPGEPVWARDADPRTTPVGAFLRRTHLDELPQLVNVLRGDMSIVGPRPERPEFIAMLEQNIPFWSRRLLIKPGITGWAQVHCGYASDQAGANEKLGYDFWYLRHRTLAVDIAVCMQTLWIVLQILAPGRMTLRRWRTARQQVAP